jgi:hypothetical protein
MNRSIHLALIVFLALGAVLHGDGADARNQTHNMGLRKARGGAATLIARVGLAKKNSSPTWLPNDIIDSLPQPSPLGATRVAGVDINA